MKEKTERGAGETVLPLLWGVDSQSAVTPHSRTDGLTTEGGQRACRREVTGGALWSPGPAGGRALRGLTKDVVTLTFQRSVIIDERRQQTGLSKTKSNLC